MKTTWLGVMVVVGFFGAGCTFPSSSRVVGRQQAGQLQRIEYGTIEKVSDVVIEGNRGPIGTYGGAVTGAAAAGAAGHGTGRDLARAGGAVAGAVAGQAVEEAVTRKDAQEMVVKMDNGSLVVVTQPAKPAFGVGDRVAVISGAGGARVTAP
jgi:outer membrane lipoprotein SlyB